MKPVDGTDDVASDGGLSGSQVFWIIFGVALLCYLLVVVAVFVLFFVLKKRGEASYAVLD